MKIAIIFGPFCLGFRRDLDLTDPFNDPRGLSGSELGTIRIAECLADMGHDVTLFTIAPGVEQFGKVKAVDLRYQALAQHVPFDVAVAINEPDLLTNFPARFKVAEMWLNDVTFCKVGFEQSVDLFVSPSEPHRLKFMTDPAWHIVEKTPEFPAGKATFVPKPEQWVALELGCDPEKYKFASCPACGDALHIRQMEPHYTRDKELFCFRCGVRYRPDCEGASYDGSLPRKISGRVVYCSSPDRGLHLLLQEWPAIKASVPEASLRIFYHVKRWVDGFKGTPYFPPIEALRKRANYVWMALEKLKALDVECVDSIPHNQLVKELSEAVCLAYPVDTTCFSEGFSCSILEGCAAQAAPIIFDTDSIGYIYHGHAAVFPRGDTKTWRDAVIRALSDREYRNDINATARALAEKLTWRYHCERLMKEVEARS